MTTNRAGQQQQERCGAVRHRQQEQCGAAQAAGAVGMLLFADAVGVSMGMKSRVLGALAAVAKKLFTLLLLYSS